MLSFTFDAVTEYGWDEQVQITEHPLETGANVSDHARRQPTVITWSAVVTETPRADRLKGIPGARRDQALTFLASCVGELLTLDCADYGAFAGYMLAGWPHVLNVEKKAVFMLTFRQVNTASAGSVVIPVDAPASSAVSSAFASASSAGEQATTSTDVNPTAAAADVSWLSSLVYGE